MTSISQIQQDQPPQVMEKLKEIKELSLSEIDKTAGWKETSNFRRFYDMPIYNTSEDFLIQ